MQFEHAAEGVQVARVVVDDEDGTSGQVVIERLGDMLRLRAPCTRGSTSPG